MPSTLNALCSIHRLYAVHTTANCTTCIVLNTPSLYRTEYSPVHYMLSVQYTVCMPYTVLLTALHALFSIYRFMLYTLLLSALHALCSIHRLYAVDSTAQNTTCFFVQYTVCMPYTLLPSSLHALFSVHRLNAVHITDHCRTCKVFNTPFVCRTQYYSVHCVQYTVCIPYTILPSALHALCSIHRLYAADRTATCTTCILFNTPSICRTHYCPLHYMQCVQCSVCMPYTLLLSALHALCSIHRFMPYTVLPSALHAFCSIHRLNAVYSTAQCTTYIVFNHLSLIWNKNFHINLSTCTDFQYYLLLTMDLVLYEWLRLYLYQILNLAENSVQI